MRDSFFVAITDGTASLASIVDHELFIVLFLSLAACDRQTDRIVNYSNSRCACARGLVISIRLSPLYIPLLETSCE